MDDAAHAFSTAALVPSAGFANALNALLAAGIEEIVARLRAEYRPTTLTEESFINAIARHDTLVQQY